MVRRWQLAKLFHLAERVSARVPRLCQPCRVQIGLLFGRPRRPPRHMATHPHGSQSRGSAPVSVFGLRGGSPLQADALRPVSEGNCVLVTGGGKQPEEKDQSITEVNSIRPGCLASLLPSGEAQTQFGKPAALRGSVLKRWQEQSGGWRWNGPKARYMKQGDLSDDRDGVHVPDSDVGTDRYEEPVAQESEHPYER